MTRTATIELRDLHIAASIGTYGPGDVVPDAHVLDMTLTIAADRVQVAADQMDLVFDYDPLIARIDSIAREEDYETQEYLMTRIIAVCATYDPIIALDICLKKQPVLSGTGSLGVRLRLEAGDLDAVRANLGS